jgi:hypothetical protein
VFCRIYEDVVEDPTLGTLKCQCPGRARSGRRTLTWAVRKAA